MWIYIHTYIRYISENTKIKNSAREKTAPLNWHWVLYIGSMEEKERVRQGCRLACSLCGGLVGDGAYTLLRFVDACQSFGWFFVGPVHVGQVCVYGSNLIKYCVTAIQHYPTQPHLEGFAGRLYRHMTLLGFLEYAVQEEVFVSRVTNYQISMSFKNDFLCWKDSTYISLLYYLKWRLCETLMLNRELVKGSMVYAYIKR